MVLGKPSNKNPLLQSSFDILSSTSPTITSSETKIPASIKALASSPRSVSSSTASLNIFPVEICGILKVSHNTSACVPLPAPGGPKRIIFIMIPL